MGLIEFPLTTEWQDAETINAHMGLDATNDSEQKNWNSSKDRARKSIGLN